MRPPKILLSELFSRNHERISTMTSTVTDNNGERILLCLVSVRLCVLNVYYVRELQTADQPFILHLQSTSKRFLWCTRLSLKYKNAGHTLTLITQYIPDNTGTVIARSRVLGNVARLRYCARHPPLIR